MEFAPNGDSVLIRDSKHRGGPVLSFSLREWRDFLDGVRRGEFDQPGHPSGGGA